MPSLQELKHGFLKACTVPLNLVGHLTGDKLLYLPKNEITQMTGGDHSVPEENAVWLFTRAWGQLRDVTVIEPSGRQERFKEIVNPKQARQAVTIWRR